MTKRRNNNTEEFQKKTKRSIAIKQPTNIQESNGTLDIIPPSAMTKILSYLPSSSLVVISSLNRFWYHKLRSWNSQEVMPIYFTARISRIKNKLTALGFEDELMSLWTQGFTDSLEKWQELDALIETAKKGLALLPNKNVNNANYKLDDYFWKMLKHFNVDLSEINANFKKEDNSLEAKIKKFEFLQKYVGSVDESLLDNTNAFVLCMLLLFSPIPNEKVLHNLMANKIAYKSLHVLRLVERLYNNDPSMLNYQRLMWVQTNLPMHTMEAQKISFIISLAYTNKSSSQIIELLSPLTSAQIASLKEVSRVINLSKFSYLKGLLAQHELHPLNLIETREINIDDLDNPSKKLTFFKVLRKSFTLARYFIERSVFLRKDLATFAKDHAVTISFLHKLKVPQLEILINKISFAEINYACNKHGAKEIYKKLFEEPESSLDMAPVNYSVAIEPYLVGFAEDKTKKELEAMLLNEESGQKLNHLGLEDLERYIHEGVMPAGIQPVPETELTQTISSDTVTANIQLIK